MKHSNMILPEACETDSLFEPYATKFMTLRQSIGFLADVYVHTAEITKPLIYLVYFTNYTQYIQKLFCIDYFPTMKSVYWLTANQSKLSKNNELHIYKGIVKPIWTCGLQILDMAAKSNITKIEDLQFNILKSI